MFKPGQKVNHKLAPELTDLEVKKSDDLVTVCYRMSKPTTTILDEDTYEVIVCSNKYLEVKE